MNDNYLSNRTDNSNDTHDTFDAEPINSRSPIIPPNAPIISKRM